MWRTATPNAYPFYAALLADIDAVTLQRARSANSRTKELVEEVVRCRSATFETPIEAMVSELTSYGSHSAVVDRRRAADVGLCIEYVAHDDEAWRAVWVLHTMYQVLQMREGRALSIVEGQRVSLIA